MNYLNKIFFFHFKGNKNEIFYLINKNLLNNLTILFILFFQIFFNLHKIYLSKIKIL